MWVMTADGIFSAVLRKDARPGEPELQIRARRRVDLNRLRKHYLPEASKVVQLEGHDYQFRIYCTAAQWADALAAMATDIDYTNFKGSVRDRDLHDALMRVWGAVLDAFPTGSIYGRYRRARTKPRSTSSGGYPWEHGRRQLPSHPGHQMFSEEDFRNLTEM